MSGKLRTLIPTICETMKSNNIFKDMLPTATTASPLHDSTNYICYIRKKFLCPATSYDLFAVVNDKKMTEPLSITSCS